VNLLASVTKLGNLAFLLFGCLVVTTSCSPSIPEHVWIPGPQYRVELEVRLDDGSSGSAAVGEWIGLRAERTSGPWVQVSSRGLEPGAPWLAQPPAARETNVEGNVRWHVEPAGTAQFNLPTTRDLFSRRVRFSERGVYTLWATSHDWRGGTVSSNRITVTVDPNDDLADETAP